MQRWDLTALAPSTRKESRRAPGPQAARVARSGHQIPRVLFSSPECRAVIVELGQGELMGDHQVHERALVQIVRGKVAIESSGATVECEAGTLVVFEPGERHGVRALAASMLLLILAPWPASQHYVDGEEADAQRLPRNASAASGLRDRP